MITLYGGGPSRWVKPYWLLQELGVSFEEKSGMFGNPELLKYNPFGKVPALQDGDFVLTESNAIVNYLAEKYSEHKLIPKSGTRERAVYDRWLAFCIGDLEQPLWRMLRHRLLYSEADRSPTDVELAKKDALRLLSVLEEEITDHLVGIRSLQQILL